MQASDVAVELRRTYAANECRLEALKKLSPSPILLPVYTEVGNVLQENNLVLQLAIGALEAQIGGAA